jgi:hypothetical protein
MTPLPNRELSCVLEPDRQRLHAVDERTANRREFGVGDVDGGEAVREFVQCDSRFEPGEWGAEAVVATVTEPEMLVR